ncbi:MAG: IclR family transcriptional regulator [Pseudonocardiales bacterium]|nr:IclR family transcriptional regulator [Pseudonocardiales bacterium]
MSSALPRAFAVIDLLVGKLQGLSLGEIAETLDLPKSAAHRTLADLIAVNYVHQEETNGNYTLTVRLVSQALRHLARIPLVDQAKPLLARLAEHSGELSRLSIVDGDSLVWVAKRQGASSGLRYDVDSGREIKLAASASGLAWLSALPDERVISLLEAQGFDDITDFGPNAPHDLTAVLATVAQVRKDGYAFTDSTYELGISTVAVPIVPRGQAPLGTLSITGPNVRLTREHALDMIPHLQDAAEQLAILGAEEPPQAKLDGGGPR